MSSPFVNTTRNDQINLMASIAHTFSIVAQLNDVNIQGNYINVDLVCSVMTNSSIGEPINRIGQINSMVMQDHYENVTHYRYSNMIEGLRNTSMSSPAAVFGARQWLYQMCNEMGFFQTTTASPDIFGSQIPIDFYTDQCEQVFGNAFNSSYTGKRVVSINDKYGGLKPMILNSMSIQGSGDPWHTVGITHSIPNSVQSIYIPGTAHCADLYSSSPGDSQALTSARLTILNFLYTLIDGDSDSSTSPVKSKSSVATKTHSQMASSFLQAVVQKLSTFNNVTSAIVRNYPPISQNGVPICFTCKNNSVQSSVSSANMNSVVSSSQAKGQLIPIVLPTKYHKTTSYHKHIANVTSRNNEITKTTNTVVMRSVPVTKNVVQSHSINKKMPAAVHETNESVKHIVSVHNPAKIILPLIPPKNIHSTARVVTVSVVPVVVPIKRGVSNITINHGPKLANVTLAKPRSVIPTLKTNKVAPTKILPNTSRVKTRSATKAVNTPLKNGKTANENEGHAVNVKSDVEIIKNANRNSKHSAKISPTNIAPVKQLARQTSNVTPINKGSRVIVVPTNGASIKHTVKSTNPIRAEHIVTGNKEANSVVKVIPSNKKMHSTKFEASHESNKPAGQLIAAHQTETKAAVVVVKSVPIIPKAIKNSKPTVNVATTNKPTAAKTQGTLQIENTVKQVVEHHHSIKQTKSAVNVGINRATKKPIATSTTHQTTTPPTKPSIHLAKPYRPNSLHPQNVGHQAIRNSHVKPPTNFKVKPNADRTTKPEPPRRAPIIRAVPRKAAKVYRKPVNNKPRPRPRMIRPPSPQRSTVSTSRHLVNSFIPKMPPFQTPDQSIKLYDYDMGGFNNMRSMDGLQSLNNPNDYSIVNVRPALVYEPPPIIPATRTIAAPTEVNINVAPTIEPRRYNPYKNSNRNEFEYSLHNTNVLSNAMYPEANDLPDMQYKRTFSMPANNLAMIPIANIGNPIGSVPVVGSEQMQAYPRAIRNSAQPVVRRVIAQPNAAPVRRPLRKPKSPARFRSNLPQESAYYEPIRPETDNSLGNDMMSNLDDMGNDMNMNDMQNSGYAMNGIISNINIF